MNKLSPSSLITLKYYALFVMFICYLPHILTEPLWLFIIFVSAIGYRVTADYFSFPSIPLWIRFLLVIVALILLNGNIGSNQFLIRFLLIFIILKCCLELHSIRDLKVLILCNFFIIFSALIVTQELWMVIYLLIAILANLSVMLKLHAPLVTFRQVSGKTSKQLLIVIPLSIILFYLFPRIAPLWHIPTGLSSSIGFSETMTFGSISEVFNDETIVMQITFKKPPVLNGYWRGIILSTYTGRSWISTPYTYFSFAPLDEIKANEIPDYEVLLEPNQTKWIFYEGYPIGAKPQLLFSRDHGMINLNKEAISHRFAYSLKVQNAPYYLLTPSEHSETTQLPINSNPRLQAWAKEHFIKTHHNIPAFITFLRDYIHQQPFWYTLTPPVLNADKNQMDHFWFETKKGFCEHYVSAATFILRAAGIPARVIIGFQGGKWNPLTNTMVIQRNDAHAWLEYWQEGVGWQQLDPTLFIASQRIDRTIRDRQIDQLNQKNYFNTSHLPWFRKIKFFLDSARFYSERWFIFYNQNTQHTFLQHIGLGKLKKEQLLQVAIGCGILFFVILALIYQWWQKQRLDLLLVEYHLLQKEFRRFNVSTPLSATLKQQCKSLIDKAPDLGVLVSSFIYNYDELRLKESTGNKKETIKLFKKFRYALRRHNFNSSNN